jgi:hypothetical protein
MAIIVGGERLQERDQSFQGLFMRKAYGARRICWHNQYCVIQFDNECRNLRESSNSVQVEPREDHHASLRLGQPS